MLVRALAACESPTAPRLPAGAVRFTPLSIYRQWWTLTEQETRFAAGETKSLIFDFHIVAGSHIRYDIAPGTWTFNGSYRGKEAASPPTVTLSP